jgi:hypothetical protein
MKTLADFVAASGDGRNGGRSDPIAIIALGEFRGM